MAASAVPNGVGHLQECVPMSPAQVVREYTYVYAAVVPALGQMVSLILPEASTSMMNLFLEQVSQSFSKYFIVMQVDQAGWHSAKDLPGHS